MHLGRAQARRRIIGNQQESGVERKGGGGGLLHKHEIQGIETAPGNMADPGDR